VNSRKFGMLIYKEWKIEVLGIRTKSSAKKEERFGMTEKEI
jgi:hypothetical protein